MPNSTTIDSKASEPKVKPAENDKIPVLTQQRAESRESYTVQDVPNTGENKMATELSNEEIAALAYQLWLERGSPHGSHDEDWLRAEEMLRGEAGLSRAAGA
jgi:ABC-type sugar transport system substrate-binding protein